MVTTFHQVPNELVPNDYSCPVCLEDKDTDVKKKWFGHSSAGNDKILHFIDEVCLKRLSQQSKPQCSLCRASYVPNNFVSLKYRVGRLLLQERVIIGKEVCLLASIACRLARIESILISTLLVKVIYFKRRDLRGEVLAAIALLNMALLSMVNPAGLTSNFNALGRKEVEIVSVALTCIACLATIKLIDFIVNKYVNIQGGNSWVG